MKFIEAIDISERRVFLRADLNVPLSSSGAIADDSRIQAVVPTIRYAIAQGARLTIASHLGRPSSDNRDAFTLLPVAERLSEILEQDVVFPDDCIGHAVLKHKRDLAPGHLLLLENLRFHGEEKANSPEFSKQLAQEIDVYINDAFGTMHRAHASVSGVPLYVADVGYGYCVRRELHYLGQLLKSPKRPFVAILGGAKVSDKIDMIVALLDRVDTILIGGAMAYTFLKAKGKPVGSSLVENGKVEGCVNILDRAAEKGVNIEIPIDHLIARALSDSAPTQTVDGSIPDGMMGVDIGPETISLYKNIISDAQTIFNNGPMGIFENPLFANGTRGVLSEVAKSSAITIIGGGDSANAVKKLNLADQMTHISTGGGASLRFLEGKSLPGLVALKKN